MLKLLNKYHYPIKIAEALGLSRQRVQYIFKVNKIPYKKMPWSETDRGIDMLQKKLSKEHKKTEAFKELQQELQDRNQMICTIYKKGRTTQRELGRMFDLKQAYINIILRNNGLLYRDRNKWRHK